MIRSTRIIDRSVEHRLSSLNKRYLSPQVDLSQNKFMYQLLVHPPSSVKEYSMTEGMIEIDACRPHHTGNDSRINLQTVCCLGILKSREYLNLQENPLRSKRYKTQNSSAGFNNPIHSKTIGEASGLSGFMRAAKEKRKGYLFFKCSA